MVDLTGIATLVLVFVTGYYAWQTRNQLSIMSKNMKREQQLKEYERLIKKMLNLVGPLFAKKTHGFLFDATESEPSRYTPWDTLDVEYFDFWDNIKINMYLGSSEIVSLLNNYFVAKDDYWIARNLRGYSRMRRTFEATTEGQQKKYEFDIKKNMLYIYIDSEYTALLREINCIEQELNLR